MEESDITAKIKEWESKNASIDTIGLWIFIALNSFICVFSIATLITVTAARRRSEYLLIATPLFYALSDAFEVFGYSISLWVGEVEFVVGGGWWWRDLTPPACW